MTNEGRCELCAAYVEATATISKGQCRRPHYSKKCR